MWATASKFFLFQKKPTLLASAFFYPFVLWAISGCAVLQDSRATLETRAAESGFAEVRGTPKHMRAWLRPGHGEITVYIEGDGAVWPRPDEPPTDPTPDRALAFELAQAHAREHPDRAVAYLARACQFLPSDALATCSSSLWRRARFGTEAVSLAQGALRAIATQAARKPMRLVGYSGGGALAMIVAADADEISCVITVASPLDTAAWTTTMRVSALDQSVNPLTIAPRLRGRAQTHFVGAEDQTVPPATSAMTLGAIGVSATVKPFDHQRGWVSAWPALMRESCLLR